MNLTAYFCPFCHHMLKADTASNEEFSCIQCLAMVDILDDDLTMVSTPPHEEIQFVATSELRLPTPIARIDRYLASH